MRPEDGRVNDRSRIVERRLIQNVPGIYSKSNAHRSVNLNFLSDSIPLEVDWSDEEIASGVSTSNPVLERRTFEPIGCIEPEVLRHSR